MEVVHTNLSLTKSREEALEDPHFNYPVPRAVLRHSTPILLDGEWNFELDPDDTGIKDGWFLGHEYKQKANWPGSVEEHLSQGKEQQQTEFWKDKVVAWYERDFPLPDQNGNKQKTMMQLTFGASGYETRVWLNGYPLRTIEGNEVHVGEYTSFSYELNERLLRPVNRLTVRIASSMDADIPRGKQESHVYKRGGIWYQTYTGAVRSIWLEVVERNRLRSRVGVLSIVEDQLVRFNVTTRIQDPGTYTLRLKIFERTDKERTQPLAQSDFPLRLEAGQKQQRVVVELPNAELWSPANPHLY